MTKELYEQMLAAKAVNPTMIINTGGEFLAPEGVVVKTNGGT